MLFFAGLLTVSVRVKLVLAWKLILQVEHLEFESCNMLVFLGGFKC